MLWSNTNFVKHIERDIIVNQQQYYLEVGHSLSELKEPPGTCAFYPKWRFASIWWTNNHNDQGCNCTLHESILDQRWQAQNCGRDLDKV